MVFMVAFQRGQTKNIGKILAVDFGGLIKLKVG